VKIQMLAICLLITAGAVGAQQGIPQDVGTDGRTHPPRTVNAPAPTRIQGSPTTLEDGTPVRLRISQTVSSADAHVDDRVEFEVLEEVTVGGLLVIPKGALALGTVTEAEPKRRMARGGKLEIVLDHVRLADGERAAVRATKEGSGGGHTGAMTGGIVATSLVFWPAAPFFLFMHGKDFTIPKGTAFPAFVEGDLPLDARNFKPHAAPLVMDAADSSRKPGSP
jgi:hypothetical protein